MTERRLCRSVIPACDCDQLLCQQRVVRLAIIEGGYPV